MGKGLFMCQDVPIYENVQLQKIMNTALLHSIFKAHGIEKVSFIKTDDNYIFLLEEMNTSIPLQRWEHLENILMDVIKENISLLPIEQAKKYFDTNKKVVISNE